MDTTLFYILNGTGLEYKIRNYCRRNIGTDGNSNFTLQRILGSFSSSYSLMTSIHLSRHPLVGVVIFLSLAAKTHESISRKFVSRDAKKSNGTSAHRIHQGKELRSGQELCVRNRTSGLFGRIESLRGKDDSLQKKI